jgi:hypothetical protein
MYIVHIEISMFIVTTGKNTRAWKSIFTGLRKLNLPMFG